MVNPILQNTFLYSLTLFSTPREKYIHIWTPDQKLGMMQRSDMTFIIVAQSSLSSSDDKLTQPSHIRHTNHINQTALLLTVTTSPMIGHPGEV
jgi:hypothetical protein